MRRTDKKEVLLDTAIRLFNRHGYHGTGVDRLMEETGISKATLYRHFPSKEDMIVAALAKVGEEVRDELRAYVEAASEDPIERILATFDQLALWISAEDFNGCPFVAAAGEYACGADAVFQQARRHKRLTLAYFEELAHAARLPEPKTLAQQLVILHEGVIACAQVLGTEGVAHNAKSLARRLIEAAQEACVSLADERSPAR